MLKEVLRLCRDHVTRECRSGTAKPTSAKQRAVAPDPEVKGWCQRGAVEERVIEPGSLSAAFNRAYLRRPKLNPIIKL